MGKHVNDTILGYEILTKVNYVMVVSTAKKPRFNILKPINSLKLIKQYKRYSKPLILVEGDKIDFTKETKYNNTHTPFNTTSLTCINGKLSFKSNSYTSTEFLKDLRPICSECGQLLTGDIHDCC